MTTIEVWNTSKDVNELVRLIAPFGDDAVRCVREAARYAGMSVRELDSVAWDAVMYGALLPEDIRPEHLRGVWVPPFEEG